MNSGIQHPDFGRLWNDFIPGPVQTLNLNWVTGHLYLKRLDLIQSWADGNKYYKLKNSLEFALQNSFGTIVSKGGMFSNHLYSIAQACTIFGLKMICIVRSYGKDHDNPLLNEILGAGHEMIFLSPPDYDRYHEAESLEQFPDALFIPEGGKSMHAISGIKELMQECLHHHPTHIIIPGGSMTTVCGLMGCAPKEIKIIVVPAWKGCKDKFIEDMLIEYNITASCQWEIWPDFHFGGFARYEAALINFMQSFTYETGIPLDPVYTGKMMFGIHQKMSAGYFKEEDSVLAIHTGGLQGIRGFAYRYPDDWRSYAELIRMQ